MNPLTPYPHGTGNTDPHAVDFDDADGQTRAIVTGHTREDGTLLLTITPWASTQVDVRIITT